MKKKAQKGAKKHAKSKGRSLDSQIPHDFVVTILLIYLLLFSVILSILQELQLFSLFFQALESDFQKGVLTVPSVILAMILLVPVIFAYYFFILAFLEILGSKFKYPGHETLAEILAFVFFSLPLIFFLIDALNVLALGIIIFYSIFAFYGLLKYYVFTSREMPESFNKAFSYKIPVIKRSLSWLKPHVNGILIIIGLIIIGKNLFLNFSDVLVVISEIKTFFQSLTIVIEFLDAFITMLSPLAALLTLVTVNLDLTELKALLGPLSLLEKAVVKFVMYMFVLDARNLVSMAGDNVSPTEKMANVASSEASSSIEGDQEISTTSSIHATIATTTPLFGVREVRLDIERRIYWLSVVSLLTFLLLEFLFTFLKIVTGVEMEELLGFVSSIVIWSLVILNAVKSSITLRKEKKRASKDV